MSIPGPIVITEESKEIHFLAECGEDPRGKEILDDPVVFHQAVGMVEIFGKKQKKATPTSALTEKR